MCSCGIDDARGAFALDYTPATRETGGMGVLIGECSTFVHNLDASLRRHFAGGSRGLIRELERLLVELEFASPGVQLDLHE